MPRRTFSTQQTGRRKQAEAADTRARDSLFIDKMQTTDDSMHPASFFPRQTT